MTKPLNELSDKELAALHRDYPRGIHPLYGPNLGAEISGRAIIKNAHYTLAAIIIAAVSAVGSMIAGIASLITVYLTHH